MKTTRRNFFKIAGILLGIAVTVPSRLFRKPPVVLLAAFGVDTDLFMDGDEVILVQTGKRAIVATTIVKGQHIKVLTELKSIV